MIAAKEINHFIGCEDLGVFKYTHLLSQRKIMLTLVHPGATGSFLFR
jgi:hypothetical protein